MPHTACACDLLSGSMSARKAPLAQAILGVGWAIMGGMLFMSMKKGSGSAPEIRKMDVHDTFAKFKPGAKPAGGGTEAATGMEGVFAEAAAEAGK